MRKVAGEDGTDEAEPVLLTGQGEMGAMIVRVVRERESDATRVLG